MKDVESEALKLSEAFDSFYKKYGFSLYRRNTLKNSKWWKFFFRASDMYSNLPDWNANIWVACQFEKHGKRYPPQLIGQEAFNTFQEYKHRFTQPKTSDSFIISLMDTYKKVLKWSEETGKNKSLFLLDKKNIFALQRGSIDSSFFVVSKIFINLDEEVKEEIMSKESFYIKRAKILENERVKNKMLELLGDDFV